MYKSTWAICCPGPSINLYETKKRIIQANPSVLVAVNGAILLDSMFDYWAVIDLEVFDSVFKLTKGGLGLGFPTLWIPEHWEEHLLSGYPHLANFFNFLKKETFPDHNSLALGQTMPFGQPFKWSDYTLFSAIALAIKKGANIIKVFGADMNGQGFCKEGLVNSRTRHTENRWKDERHFFEQLVDLCSQNGIIVSKEEAKE